MVEEAPMSELVKHYGLDIRGHAGKADQGIRTELPVEFLIEDGIGVGNRVVTSAVKEASTGERCAGRASSLPRRGNAAMPHKVLGPRPVGGRGVSVPNEREDSSVRPGLSCFLDSRFPATRDVGADRVMNGQKWPFDTCHIIGSIGRTSSQKDQS